MSRPDPHYISRARRPAPGPLGATLRPSWALGAALALVLAGCGPVVAGRAAAVRLKLDAPHRITVTADGVVRYEQTGPMPLVLLAPPGTRLCAGPDGVLAPCK